MGLASASASNSIKKSFRGSMMYASIAAHRCEKVIPSNDLESLGYVLCDFYRSLPWLNNKISYPKDPLSLMKYILRLKENTKIKDLTSGFFELTQYFLHIKENENPSYEKLKNIFRQKRDGFSPNFRLGIIVQLQQ